jgi:hypothetical protein
MLGVHHNESFRFHAFPVIGERTDFDGCFVKNKYRISSSAITYRLPPAH